MIGIPLQNPFIAYYDNYQSIAASYKYISCKIIDVPKRYDVKSWSYAFQKDSPYLEIFNYYMKALEEKGTSRQILDKYKSEPQVCIDKSGSPLGFESCFTAFLILCGGGILGCVLFVIEMVFSKFIGFDLSKLYQENMLRNDHLCHYCSEIVKAKKSQQSFE